MAKKTYKATLTTGADSIRWQIRATSLAMAAKRATCDLAGKQPRFHTGPLINHGHRTHQEIRWLEASHTSILRVSEATLSEREQLPTKPQWPNCTNRSGTRQ